MAELDALDLALVTALRENPRAGVLELSRVTRVARATVESRLKRMEQAGAVLTTVEGCAFEWVGGSAHPQFKAISKLVQDRMKQVRGG